MGIGETDGENRDRILQFIKDKPGCHLRQIRKDMKISMGSTQYNLNNLEKAGKITSVRTGLYRYYFPIGVFHNNEKNLLQILNQEMSREILMCIIEKTNPTHSDIVEKVDISSSALSWHISHLVEYQVVKVTRDGKFKRYELATDPKYLIALMKNYYPSVWIKWSSRLAEIFILLSSEKENDEQ
jgi:predicted transcriptional regulator